MANYGQLQRFDNARQAVAFAGLDPPQHVSGSSVKAKPRLSKLGHPCVASAALPTHKPFQGAAS